MPKKIELICFKKLKEEVISTFLIDFPNISKDASAWKGMHIMYFQEHLFNKTKGNVSDRWFYTYFKAEPQKAPRIDMLNILSTYCGYQDWDEFMAKHKEEIAYVNEDMQVFTTHSQQFEEKILPKKKYKKQIMLSSIVAILVSAVFLGYNRYDKVEHTYKLYLKDTDRNKNIIGIEVIVPSDSYDPKKISDSLGKIEVFSHLDTLKLVVNPTFYKRDTFEILLNKSDGTETLELTPNDYALMLNYYSRSKKSNIKRKMAELNKLIDENALIYQVYDNEDYGQEVYSKAQYITFMTTPTTSLENYELIDSKEQNGKIVRIKFKIKPNEIKL